MLRTPGGMSSTLDKGFKEPEQKLSLTGTAVQQDQWLLTARLYVQAQGWENSRPHFIFFVSKHVDTDLFPLFHTKLQETGAFRDLSAVEGWVQSLHPRALDATLDRLEKIRQGHRIVRLYVAEFEGVLAEIPLASRPADCTLQRAFRRGLHPGLVRLLAACPHVRTYTEAKQEVFRLKQYLLAMEGYRGAYGQQEFPGRQPARLAPGGQQHFAGARFNSQRDPGVPAKTFAPPRGNFVPATQKKSSQNFLKRQQPATATRTKTTNPASVKSQRRREGGCFKCGSTDHWARDCPLNKGTPGGQVNAVEALTVNAHSSSEVGQPPEAGGLRLIASLTTTHPTGQRPTGSGQCMMLQAPQDGAREKTPITKVGTVTPAQESTEPWENEDSVAEILGPDCEAARQEEGATGLRQSTPPIAITDPDLLEAWEQDQRCSKASKPSEGPQCRALGRSHLQRMIGLADTLTKENVFDSTHWFLVKDPAQQQFWQQFYQLEGRGDTGDLTEIPSHWWETYGFLFLRKYYGWEATETPSPSE